MQICMATTNMALRVFTRTRAWIMESREKRCTWQNMFTWTNKWLCVPHGLGARHEWRGFHSWKRALRRDSDESSNPGDESAFVSYPYAWCERSLVLVTLVVSNCICLSPINGFITALRLCLHENFQPGSSAARVESLYDRQKRWAFTCTCTWRPGSNTDMPPKVHFYSPVWSRESARANIASAVLFKPGSSI